MKVLIIDTNILCVYLKVPFMDDAGYQVEILTADQGLKSYEPAITNTIPRRRKR